MLHNVILLRRRFPTHATRIVVGAVILSVCALAVGVGLLLLA